MISLTSSEEERAIARGLSVPYRILRDRSQVGFISCSATGHFDVVALDGARFDLPESQPLFGSDVYVVVMRLKRIGCTVKLVVHSSE